jgi:hypothetical protein
MRKLTLIGLLALAATFGTPRPASAQWMAFMRWLSGLDPGKMTGMGYHFTAVCLLPIEPHGFTLEPGTRVRNRFGCGKPDAPTLLNFGFDLSLARGPSNLPPNPSQTLWVAAPIATLDLSYAGVEYGVGAGFLRLWGGERAATNLVVEKIRTGVKPVMLVRSLAGKAGSPDSAFWATVANIQFRYDRYSFPTDFTPSDFGAPPGPPFHHGETIGVWAIRVDVKVGGRFIF